jgi:hypothetical protein
LFGNPIVLPIILCKKEGLALQMNIQQCTHIAICKSIGKIMTQMENICCCGVALLVKLLTTIFLQVELIFILKKQSSSTKHNNKCT